MLVFCKIIKTRGFYESTTHWDTKQMMQTIKVANTLKNGTLSDSLHQLNNKLLALVRGRDYKIRNLKHLWFYYVYDTRMKYEDRYPINHSQIFYIWSVHCKTTPLS